MIKSKIVKKVIETELTIWKTAYPSCAKVLDKFANKILFELQWRVRDPPMAGFKEKKRQGGNNDGLRYSY